MSNRSVTLRTLLCSVVVVLASLAGTANAQQTLVNRVDVPFGFHSGGHILPPGRYTISMHSDGIMLVRGTARSSFMIVSWGEDGHPAYGGKLVFRRYGNEYFLRQVWTKGSSEHVECAPQKEERHLRELAAVSAVANDVELALVQPAH